MALTQEDLQAIGALMDHKLSAAWEPITARLDTMQADISGLRQGQAKLEQRQAKLEQGQAKLEQGQTKLEQGQTELQEGQQAIRASQVKVELEQYPRIAAALDGIVAGIEKDKEQDERIVGLERKSDNHDTRIYALEASLKKTL